MLKKIETARLALSSLTVYRGLLGDEVIDKYMRLLEAVKGVELRGFLNAYSDFYYSLLKREKLSLLQYYEKLLKASDNIFSRHAKSGEVEPELLSAAENDLRLLEASIISADEIKGEALKNFDGFGSDFIKALPEWRSEEVKIDDARGFINYYKNRRSRNY